MIPAKCTQVQHKLLNVLSSLRGGIKDTSRGIRIYHACYMNVYHMMTLLESPTQQILNHLCWLGTRTLRNL